jgi:hypothetical protein
MWVGLPWSPHARVTERNIKDLVKSRGYALARPVCGIALPIALQFDIPSSCFLLAAMASSLFDGRKPGLLAVASLFLLSMT